MDERNRTCYIQCQLSLTLTAMTGPTFEKCVGLKLVIGLAIEIVRFIIQVEIQHFGSPLLLDSA